MSLETPGVPVASASVGSRKVSTKPHDPNRFYCPFPGCKRSFAELWRLKVHYRAPPDVRGSGKERGHGAELAGCPKCGVDLKPGKHHVGCFGGRTTTRQARRRNAKEEEGSRKRARTGEATLPIMQHLAPQYPQQPPQLQRDQLLPNSLAWESRESVMPSQIPVGPFLMNFSQFSRPIPEAVVFTPSVTRNPLTLDEISDQYSPFVFGNAGEAPIMATANLACDVNTCIPGQFSSNCNYQETTPASLPAPKPDPIWLKDDLQMGLVEIDRGVYNAGDYAHFFNDTGPGMAPLARNSNDCEV